MEKFRPKWSFSYLFIYRPLLLEDAAYFLKKAHLILTLDWLLPTSLFQNRIRVFAQN